MKELLTYIVQSLVDDPAQVSVTERKADGEIILRCASPTAIWARSSAATAGSSSRSAS